MAAVDTLGLLKASEAFKIAKEVATCLPSKSVSLFVGTLGDRSFEVGPVERLALNGAFAHVTLREDKGTLLLPAEEIRALRIREDKSGGERRAGFA